jgi:putative ABC transport system permease protein
MDGLRQDLSYAWRMLTRNPGFSAALVLVIGLGIGANTAIFSVVNAVLLKPLPYEDPDRLVHVREVLRDRFGSVTAPNFADWSEQNHSFTALAARERATFTLTGEGEAERIAGLRVSASYFPLLGIAPVQGRGFLPEDTAPGAPDVALLSEGLWRTRFGADPAIVGRAVSLDQRRFMVVGVMPAGVALPTSVEQLYAPLVIGPEQLRQTGNHRLSVIGRLKPGVELAQATSDMRAIAHRLETVRPQSNQGWSVDLSLLGDRIVENVRSGVLLLFGAVGFVALVACANVANLLLARAARRQREIAVRAAVGAGRLRLVRQLLSESLLIALLGGALGLLLAFWGAQALVLLLPAGVPRLGEVDIDATVLGFTIALSLLTGLVFGLAPALQASGIAPRESLKEGARSAGAGRASERLRGGLMVAEVAIALLLLVGAGLLVRSFLRVRDVSPGFDTRDLVALELSLPASAYPEPGQVSAFYREALERVAALPGVTAAAATSHLPIASGGFNLSVKLEGAPAPARPSEVPTAFYRAVSPNYFAALGIPLLRGRPFDERDVARTPRVAIVNETMARQLWRGQDPIGKRFTLDENDTSPIEVVGVASDVRAFGLDSDPAPELHVPYAQGSTSFWAWTGRSLTLVLRGSGNAAALAPPLRATIAGLDKDLPVYNVRTMDEVLAASVASRRASMLLIGVFAAAALILAAVGLYGVVSYAVGQRTHEFGVRMALGAGERDVVRLVLGRGIKLAVLGLLLGSVGALALSRLLSSLVYGISPRDPLTYVGVGLLLFTVALVASYLPARRAARVEPVTALRHE